jgi:transketolase
MAETSMREGFGHALLEHGGHDPKIVVLDVDTSSSTLSKFFADRYPERFFNVGIAEPCMIDVAVGLALGGWVPFANGFAALIGLRALEQIRTCVCYARTNVKLVAGYAGLSDFKDGPTHHAISDIANMRALPGMTVIVPGDAQEAGRWVPVVAAYDGPLYIRLSRAATLPVPNQNMPLQIGKALRLRSGEDVTLIANGAMVGRCIVAAERLAAEDVQARVLEVHTVKPLDIDEVLAAAEETGAVVTAEEHSVIGGLGSAVAECLCGRTAASFERVGIPDTFARTAPDVDQLLDAYGLSIEQICAAALRAVRLKGSHSIGKER